MNEELQKALMALMQAIQNDNHAEAMLIILQHPELLEIIQQMQQQHEEEQNPLRSLSNQAQSAEQRYLQRGDVSGLDEAIDYWQQILQHPDFSKQDEELQLGVLNDSAVTYWYRYGAKGVIQDLDRALQTWQALVKKLPNDSPYLPRLISNLGAGLSNRYARLGELADLQAGIAAYQQAIAHTPPDSPDLAAMFNNLGNGLTDRYSRLGDLADLQAGIKAYQQAIDQTPPDSPDLAGRLNNLGAELTNRYTRLGELADLQAGIAAAQQAIAHTPPNSPDLARRLNGLGLGLTNRYARLGDLADLQAGIAAFRQALDHTPLDSPDLARHLHGLGAGLRDRYARLGELADLQDGIAAYKKAIAHTPPDSPDLARLLNNLGLGLSDRYAQLGELADLQAGIAAYQQAIELAKKGSLEDLLKHSRNFLLWAFERDSWQEMAAVYPNIQTASQHLMEKQLLREQQEAFLTETQGLAARMAYARIQTQDLASAVEVLEQGVARLLSAALAGDNTDVSPLQQAHPDLYARYKQQRQTVRQAQRDYQNADAAQREAALKHWQTQEAAFKAVLSEIRQQPAHENFLTIPTDIQRVYQAAHSRPLVYLFDTPKGGYALRVLQQDIQAIALPELSFEKLQAQGNKYFEADFNAHTQQQAWHQAIEDLSTWLYTAIMQPLLPQLPRAFTFIPIGYLNLFPLHLAWTKENGTRHYMVDKFTINYAPNALALVNAQKSAILPSDNLLLINEPKPVEASELPSSIMESIAIKQHFKQNRELPHEQATVSAVKEALNNSPNVLHFTCHGGANVQNPLKTGLLMANNEMLTVADFFQAQLQARLVSLSACQTGVIGFKKAEEVVGLPTSLLHAGAVGVLASLWSVEDASTALLMTRFYHNFMQQKQAP
ncbi:CHAT domain-containing protein [Thioflexithrix psekupsensis]|uniref:CHAT domain-containing protein n=1 Tax=Thioflexithrix psekupsensis TaxID=1570016 RepID=A0A251X8E5_9GAMM|nr:CHAT domain-containing protein [Thioflexithrix psekupsensis]OUD14200.1 hypothetical protein TPSD3_07670 [Thioflexithrix psekupsensis]